MNLNIIGIGPGNIDYILPIAKKKILESDLVLGFNRVLNDLVFLKNNKKFFLKSLKDIKNIVNKNLNKNISIVASGDPGFYGILEYLKKNTKFKLNVLPGISSLQYFCSKLNFSWFNIKFYTLHGRNFNNLINFEEDFDKIFILTDKINNPKKICEKLLNQNYKIFIGENLSYKDEKIFIGKAKDLVNNNYKDLCVVIIENENFKR